MAWSTQNDSDFLLSRKGFRNMDIPARELYGFGVELRKLAYTMPGGHENTLVGLSERMTRRSREESDDDEPPQQRAS